jgi:hypothetical protein
MKKTTKPKPCLRPYLGVNPKGEIQVYYSHEPLLPEIGLMNEPKFDQRSIAKSFKEIHEFYKQIHKQRNQP